MGTEFDEGRETLDRRQAIKKAAVGAAAAGVVWSAPKVQGLSLRPNYAAAASFDPINQVGSADITVNFPGGVGTTGIAGPAVTVGDGTIAISSVFLSNADGSGTFNVNPAGGVDNPAQALTPVTLTGIGNVVTLNTANYTSASGLGALGFSFPLASPPTGVRITFTCA